MKSKLSIFIMLLVLSVVVAGCGGDGAGYPSTDEVQADVPTGTTSGTDVPESKPGETPKVTGPISRKPKIAQPNGEPPEKLVIKDIKKGTGKVAKDGDKVAVAYVGINWSNAREFDTSWGKDPFEFDLGTGGVIKGWDEGVKGMRVGGRRELVIPPDLGYGPGGSGEAIGPNETLVFVVDLKKVK